MNIFFLKNLLYIFFYFSHKLLISCDENTYCSLFPDCYKCVLCLDEDLTSCKCVWTNTGCSYSNYGNYLESDNWYSKIITCQNLDSINGVDNVYCPKLSSIKSESDLDKDKSIIFTTKKDSRGFYGLNLVLCVFEYEQNIENDLTLNFEFSSLTERHPRIYVESTDITNIKTKTNIDTNREIEFTRSTKVIIKVLLKDAYTSPPITIKLAIKTSQMARVMSIIITVLFIGILAGCVIFCIYRMYKNNEARKEARMFLYRQARENMARIEQENNYYNNDENSQEESVDIEAANKEKLDKLFSTKMAQHLYKKEYNEFGGGCSICLAEFKKKSKVSITSCKHVFHYQCIHDWLYKNIRNPKCPNCNHEILNDAEEVVSNKIKDNNIIKEKKKSAQLNNNINQHLTVDRGQININNGGSGSIVDASQSQRPQLGDY